MEPLIFLQTMKSDRCLYVKRMQHKFLLLFVQYFKNHNPGISLYANIVDFVFNNEDFYDFRVSMDCGLQVKCGSNTVTNTLSNVPL